MFIFSSVVETKKKTEEEAKGARLTKELVGGKVTASEVKTEKAETEGRKEVERVMVTAEAQPKTGTTKELAKIHPDHRKKVDET